MRTLSPVCSGCGAFAGRERARALRPGAARAARTPRELRQWAYEQALALFGERTLPHAVLAFSDLTALRILEAAEERGIRVPEDLSLVGYDNVSYAAIPRIHLTTVSQHKFQQGRIAVERLLCQIQGTGGRQRTCSSRSWWSAPPAPPEHKEEGHYEGIPNTERQRLGALLDHETQETVMAMIPSFRRRRSAHRCRPRRRCPEELGLLVFNMERGVHLEELGDFLQDCRRPAPGCGAGQ